MDQHNAGLSRVEALEHFVGPPSLERLNLASVAAHEELSKAELSRVERLEQLAVPPLSTAAEVEAAQDAAACSASRGGKPPSAKCWRPRQLWRISMPKPSLLRRTLRRPRRRPSTSTKSAEPSACASVPARRVCKDSMVFHSAERMGRLLEINESLCR